ncbi:MAG: zinc ribbon domain-containing protein [Planctomycetes bacterium]|nr:zinc ribbon domain-containing protein [Planctomycetota bacterium]
MALFFRCPCTAVLEAPDGTRRGRTFCPTCRKVVVIPQDAVSLSPKDIEDAKAALAEISPPEGIPVMPGMPPVEEPVAAVEDSLELAPPVPPPPPQEDIVPVGAVSPYDKTEQFPAAAGIPEVVLPPADGVDLQEPELITSPAADEEAAQLFAEAPAVSEAELLPEIPEIPDPAARKTAPPPPVAQPAPAKKAPAKKQPAGPPIVAGKKPSQPSSRKISSSRRSSRTRSRRGDFAVCPACGEEVNAGIKVCPNCGERIKKGSLIGKLFVFLLVVLFLVGGLAAAVMFVPDKLPASLVNVVKNVGAKLKAIDVPVPPSLLPDGYEDASADASGDSPAAGETPTDAAPADDAVAEEELPAEAPMDIPLEPTVVIDDDLGGEPKPEIPEDVIIDE